MGDGAPWLRSSSAARVGDRKPLCVPLIDYGGGFESAVEIKCLIAVRSGLSSQSQEQQRVAGLICLGPAGVNRAAAGCRGQLAVGSGGRWWCGEGQLPWPALELTSLAPPKKKQPQSLWVQDAAAQRDL